MRDTQARNALALTLADRVPVWVRWWLRRRRLTHSRSYPFEDAVQQAWVGVLRAAEEFDADRGVKFGTFAWEWMRCHLNLGADRCRVVRRPHPERTGRGDDIGRKLAAKELEADGLAFLLADRGDGPERSAERNEAAADVRRAVASLPPAQRAAVLGFMAGVAATAEARRRGVARDTVSQALARAADRLAPALAGHGGHR